MKEPAIFSEPPIHQAARTGDLVMLERLVGEGCDVNLRMDEEFENGWCVSGMTPLMVAARSEDGATVETVRWLLEHGADLRARSEGGGTAAWFAAGDGARCAPGDRGVVLDREERLRVLLDAGLDHNETDLFGRSLLAEASGAGDPARVRLLLGRGAWFDRREPEQGSLPPVDWRVLRREEMRVGGSTEAELAAFDENCGALNPAGREDDTIPLFRAAESGSAECIGLLLEAGASVDERDREGRTALMHAGSADAARRLIEAGANTRERTPDGDDVIHMVLYWGPRGTKPGDSCRFEVANVLIEHGAPLQESGRESGFGRLYEAAFSRDAEAVDFLLGVGCDAKETDKNGQSALEGICWHSDSWSPGAEARCEEIIKRLVGAGASVTAREGGRTPVHQAANGDGGNVTAIRTLLELGASPDPVADDGTTPLMLAAENGELGCLKVLLEAGADPRRVSKKGNTALDLASGHLEAWRRNVRSGPSDPLYGRSVEECAAAWREALQKAQMCFDLLEGHGANPNGLKSTQP